ncbi:MAG TPA: cytochrome C oxidase subunit IV family protein [Pseudobdellovibrionaceae bacterium]|nr:cytochrome C oxidase subunit IV family protein [Pseudobdellovibrionaceae bacterium]
MAQSNKDVHHVVEFSILLKTGIALFGLTFLTMFAFWMHHYLGAAGPIVAFLIAGVKAALVMMFFMGLKYDSLMNRFIFALGFFFLLLLFTLSALDIWTRVPLTSTL